jgi:hypothetical protein
VLGYEYFPLHRAVAMMAKHEARFHWAGLVTRRYGLDEAGQALSDKERLAVVKAVIGPGPGE